MKNRKNIVIAFLLVASLCLSVGFAALTDTLNINGNINVGGDNTSNEEAAKEWDADVYFSSVNKTSKTGNANDSKYTVAIDTTATKDNLTVNLESGCLSVNGDSVTFTATIKNESNDYAATISAATVTGLTNVSDYISVTANVPEGNIEPGATKDVTITIKLIKTPADSINVTNLNIAFTATTAAPASGT